MTACVIHPHDGLCIFCGVPESYRKLHCPESTKDSQEAAARAQQRDLRDVPLMKEYEARIAELEKEVEKLKRELEIACMKCGADDEKCELRTQAREIEKLSAERDKWIRIEMGVRADRDDWRVQADKARGQVSRLVELINNLPAGSGDYYEEWRDFESERGKLLADIERENEK